MVSQITTGHSTDKKGRPFPRRRTRPALILIALLIVMGLITWIVALVGGDAQARPVNCNQPTPASADPSASAVPDTPTTSAAAPPTLTAMSRDEMLAVAPAALSTFQVRVLNASNQRGAARSVSDDLTGMGFNPVADTPYTDDTVYPNRDLDCVAQIRFGPAGKAAAASVWLAIPCAQLVDDARTGTSVDVALGQYWESPVQTQDAQAALEALRTADPRNPSTGAEPELVKAVHSQTC